MSFKTIRSYILSILSLLVIVFVLPVIADYFTLPKWFFVGFLSLLLLLSSVGEFLISKKIVWTKKEFDGPITLFVIAGALSVLFGSTNKIQAIINPHFGLLTFIFLFLIYYYFSRSHKKLPHGGSVLSVFAVIFSVTVLFETVPFISTRLPNALQKFQNMTLAGTLIDALIFLGFAGTVALSKLLKKEDDVVENIISFLGFVFTTITSLVILFTLVKNSSVLALPSTAHSWYATVEVLKQPMTALFGVGIDNFQTLFVRVKDISYNNSALWQVPTFSLSRSAVFHIMSEMGLLGLSAFGLIFSHLIRRAFADEADILGKLLAFYFVAVFFLFPPSFILFFLLFVWIGISNAKHSDKQVTIDFSEIVPAYALLIFGGLVAIGASCFMLGRVFMSEYTFQKALSTNNLKDVYEQMRTAVSYNPYNERVRTNYVQVHLLIANTVASKATKNEKGEPELSETDRQTVSQAIQAAIDEAKAVVSLNPTKAANWDLLATVYRSIAGVVQGADSWTISAYQRAIVLDPQNPTYRVALGGVLYGYKQYDDAMRLFEQAISLKPDWANAHYNYAWAAAQKGDYQKAASSMQTCITLLNPSSDTADYKKATADLEEFKKQLPAEEQQSNSTETEQTQQQKESLSLPPTSVPQLEQKIELPNTASPEAR